MQKFSLLSLALVSCFFFFGAQTAMAGMSCMTVEVPTELQNSLAEATKDIPCERINSLQTIEVFDDPSLPRAMANARILKVNKSALDDPEIVDVLIHELGHVVDLGGLTSSFFEAPSVFKDGNEPIYEDDVSVRFYSLSWNTENQRKTDAIVQDFAGEYASTDPFEDFAEGFLLYIQHGNEFRKMARHNDVMAQKYNFFKETVFSGTEFNSGSRKISAEKRVWDVTKM
jgi:hypothetical protein